MAYLENETNLPFGSQYSSCKQTVIGRCKHCKMYVKFQNEKATKCEKCNKTISVDDEEETESAKKKIEDVEELLYEVQKDGTKRLACKTCNRLLSCCPTCDSVYDDKLDIDYEARKNRKRKSTRKRLRYAVDDDDEVKDNEEQADDEDSEHEDDEVLKRKCRRAIKRPRIKSDICSEDK